MLEPVDLNLKDGSQLKCVVLAEAVSFVVVRTVDNKYKMVSREFIKTEESDD